MTVFIRLLEVRPDDKPAALLEAVNAIAMRNGALENNARVFELNPELFSTIPTSPFPYWARASWLETFRRFTAFGDPPRLVVSTNPLNADFRYARLWWEVAPQDLGRTWRPWAKGGAFSPHYYDVNTVIAWNNDRSTYTGFLGTENRPLERPASVQHFFRPGLTWPSRTQSGFGMRAMPAGCVFGDKGPAAFIDGDSSDELLCILALATSSAFMYLVECQMAFGSYVVGVIQRTPLPDPEAGKKASLAAFARRAWSLRRLMDTSIETSHAFVLPHVLNEKITGFNREAVETELGQIQEMIDEFAFQLYDIEPEDRETIKASSKRSISTVREPDSPMSEDDEANVDDFNLAATGDSVISWLVGVAFGRFDPRLATGERDIPAEPDPFCQLPSRSPGMYPENETPDAGIVVDDEGHSSDLAAQLRNWADYVSVDISPNLRQWLARDFFPLHIKMYSKSRRKAPIYWQLATPSASYSVWLYIHAFTRDTLFRVQNDYVAPKLAHEERRLEAMTREVREKGTAGQRKGLSAQENFVGELRAFLDEVKRVAPLWNPNLDDGVIINFAPLWRLVPQHKAWQKELKSTWDELCEGKYDWAHLAMHLWPERVVPKCATDRSLAIAHELEDVFWIEGSDGKWTARKNPTRSVDELVQERTAPAVKAALRSLLDAPQPSGSGRKAKKG